MDASPVPRRLRSSDDGEPCRLRGFPGLGRPLGDLGLSSGDRTPTAFWGACMDPTGQTGSGLRQRIAALHGAFMVPFAVFASSFPLLSLSLSADCGARLDCRLHVSGRAGSVSFFVLQLLRVLKFFVDTETFGVGYPSILYDIVSFSLAGYKAN